MNLLNQVSDYVTDMLTKKLSANLKFHNMTHTYQVVAATVEIGAQSGLSEENMLTVQIAAWFHDCGYTKVYIGHENESIKIAMKFLKQQTCKKEFVTAVCRCIEATRFPQRPKTLIEEVLCDADFYHLTRPNYSEYEQAIRLELETYLNLSYTDEEWKTVNCTLLTKHHYFTNYGRNVLKKFKDLNLQIAGYKTG